MSAITPLTPEQRAAVVFVSLDREVAEDMANRLGPSAIERVKTALQSLSHIPREELLGAFAMFLTELESRRGGLLAGEARAATLLRSVLGELPDPDLIDEPTRKAPIIKGTIWKRFARLDPEMIAGYVEKQGATLGAVMLSRLPGEAVAEVLSALSQDLSVDIIDLMARETQPTEAAYDVVEKMIADDLLSEGADMSKDPKLTMIGEMLGALPKSLREAALNKITTTNEERANVVRSKLLSLDDIPDRLPTRSVQVIFRDIDSDVLVPGLKAAGVRSPEVVEFLLSNITQRMADRFRDEIDRYADMDARAIDKASANLLREILSLNRRGAIALAGPSADEVAA